MKYHIISFFSIAELVSNAKPVEPYCSPDQFCEFVGMIVIIHSRITELSLSHNLFDIFHFYIADLSTNVEPYCSPDQFGEFVGMIVIIHSSITELSLSHILFVIFHFYIANLSTNIEPYCSPDQFSELLRCLSLYIHDYIILSEPIPLI